MIITKEMLQERLTSISPVEDRVRNWEFFAKRIDEAERALLIDAIETNEESKESISFELDTVPFTIQGFVEPLKELQERISFVLRYYEQLDSNLFRKEMEERFNAEKKKIKDFIKSEALKYFIEYKGTSQIERETYSKNVKSFATPFLFQAPMITDKEKRRRDIINEVFRKWDAYALMIEFCNEVDKLLK